jgi:hypothetical protein
MSKIEDGAATLSGILLYNVHLYGNGTLNERGEDVRITLVHRLSMGLHEQKKLRIGDDAGFDNFAQATEVFSLRQGLEQGNIRKYGTWRIESPYEVLPKLVIDPCLPTNAAINHGQ